MYPAACAIASGSLQRSSNSLSSFSDGSMLPRPLSLWKNLQDSSPVIAPSSAPYDIVKNTSIARGPDYCLLLVFGHKSKKLRALTLVVWGVEYRFLNMLKSPALSRISSQFACCSIHWWTACRISSPFKSSDRPAILPRSLLPWVNLAPEST